MSTDRQRQERYERAERERREARRLAAVNVGHPDWALLPETFRDAKAFGKSYVFTGKSCEWGHIARVYVWNRKCEECSRRKSQIEIDQRYWDDQFSLLADRIETTGRMHSLKKAGQRHRIVETSRVVPEFENLRKACAKASKFTARDGVLRCVVPGATCWVVKKVAS